MSRSLLPDVVERYVFDHVTAESDVLRELRADTSRRPDAGMQIGADQGAFMALLVRLIGARHCLELGTFTGYSALVVAQALPSDGRLITCDVDPEATAIARRAWKRAGVSDRIELRLGPALETLAALTREAGAGSFDFVFIDADKPAYPRYYEACLTLARPGGIILLDNMLWSGKVADPSVADPDTTAIRELNARIRDDARVEAVLLSIGDGVMLARKR